MTAQTKWLAPIYVLYHASCKDGMGAAYAAWKHFGDDPNVSYIAVQYGNPPPEMALGSFVYILDFSFDKETLLALKEKMQRVVIIDHHKTAKEALEGIEDTVFDMEHSGAVLSWKYFHKGKPVPEILLAIEDRDLWKFQRSDTKIVGKGIESVIDDFKVIDQYAQDTATYNTLRAIGAQKDYFDNIELEKCVYKCSVCTTEGSYKYAISNTTNLISEVGHQLCKILDVRFSITYFITNDKVVFSLRSIGDKPVHQIAIANGGGGHYNAAGYSMELKAGLEHLRQLLEGTTKITRENIKEFSK